ncbi:hypothetical protein LZF95_20185 [Algoriphagus sp. AGSA1]|nr:hypothetical protein [Algoriphagus sp. AGSA1]
MSTKKEILLSYEDYFELNRCLGLAEKSQVCQPWMQARQVQGGRVMMYAYTSNEAKVEEGMAEASLKIPILGFSDV